MIIGKVLLIRITGISLNDHQLNNIYDIELSDKKNETIGSKLFITKTC